MKATFLRFSLALAAVAVVSFSTTTLEARQNRKLDFTLVNKTGIDIYGVFVSPSDDDEWGEDVMGKDTLDDGEKVDIEFDRSETTCKWDLKVTDEDDKSIVWTNLDLCKANEITLKYEGKKPTAVIK